MNFNTQVCTNREQSERLLALGLKKETADMGLAVDIPIAIEDWKTQDTTLIDSPAWSLHRLIEMMPGTLQDLYTIDFSKRGVYYADFSNGSFNFVQSFANINKTLYDNIIDCIEWLIKVGYFNKEYLEEQI